MLLIITSCPATLARLRLAQIPHTQVADVDAAEAYLAAVAHRGIGPRLAYGPDVAAAEDARRIDGVRDPLLVVAREPEGADWRNAVRLGVKTVVQLPLGADWLRTAVAAAASAGAGSGARTVAP